MIKQFTFVFMAVLLMVFVGCASKAEKSQRNYKPLNITLLLDLSDRISSAKYPRQSQQDKEIILSIVEAFKANCQREGAVFAKDKMKVVFYPDAYDAEINHISYQLKVDLDKTDIANRKGVFDSIAQCYRNNIDKLYSLAANARSYNGSDIFSYFKYRVEDDCIDTDTNYQNILIILSDGFMYYAGTMYNEGNRYSYILENATHFNRFTSTSYWKEQFDAGDYGFVRIDKDLSRLSVIGCEFAPQGNSPKNFDIQSAYWSKWLSEMHIRKQNYKLLRHDFAMLNSKLVSDFLLKHATKDQNE